MDFAVDFKPDICLLELFPFCRFLRFPESRLIEYKFIVELHFANITRLKRVLDFSNYDAI